MEEGVVAGDVCVKMGCGVWGVGYGLWGMGCGLWVVGCGVRSKE